ncbi:phage baseplate assembly protein V [Micromonospora sp. NPDC000089]|uniref:phage baseplate assembly protein V n=1 Tax=unclassified Micromonospora TaxID=2617518 RepID=UPI0036A5B63E
MTAWPTVLLDGVPLAGALAARLRAVRIAARLDQPTQCELVYATGPGAGALGLGPGPAVPTGATLDVRLGDDPLFAGEVTCVEVEYPADGAPLLRLRGYDPLHRLRKRQRLRVFESVTVADLVREVCAEVGLTVAADVDGPRLDRVTQHRHSDLDLLLEVAGRAGLHLAADDDRVHLITLDGYGEPLELTLGATLHAVRLAVNLDRAAGDTAALGWHPQRAEPISQRADTARSGRRVPLDPDPASVGADGTRTAVDQPGRSDDELAAIAQAGLDARVAALVTADGVAEGDPALRPGRRVTLTGVADEFAGVYVLTEVVHTVDGNGHLTRFGTAPPAAPPVAAAPGTVVTLGTVTEVDDPDRLGRIRLTLPAYGDLDAGWLAVLTPGAGKGKGIVALPDPDDTVLVALPGGEPAAGIVLGSLFGTVEPYDAGIADGRSGRWSVRTGSGQTIVVDDAARTLRLATDNGSFLELTPALTTLHAATDLVLSAPGRAMVVRARSVDFLHADATEDAATARDQAGALARAHSGGG